VKNVRPTWRSESEAAMGTEMRHRARFWTGRFDSHEDLLARLCTAVGKSGSASALRSHAAEAMECIGGSGVIGGLAGCRACCANRRSTRSWEGSGNIQCLDALRAMNKTPVVAQAYLTKWRWRKAVTPR